MSVKEQLKITNCFLGNILDRRRCKDRYDFDEENDTSKPEIQCEYEDSKSLILLQHVPFWTLGQCKWK
jgi:hypothetical protein